MNFSLTNICIMQESLSRHMWRFTPDTYLGGVTIENVKVNDVPLTFQIGKQVVEFPEGSFIYEPTRERKYANYSKAGYWIISPEGTEPKKYLDEGAQEPPAPTYMYDSKRDFPNRLKEYYANQEYRA